jgi:hypothetical protein
MGVAKSPEVDVDLFGGVGFRPEGLEELVTRIDGGRVVIEKSNSRNK